MVRRAAAATTAFLIAAASTANAQYNQTHNLTPDGYWHNRYHQIVSMAAYGEYDSLCPQQTFTEQQKLRNFPNSTRAPWTLIERWGPTKSGCEGFSAVVPEMNKVLMVFRGNYAYEQVLPEQVVPWSSLTQGLGQACPTCTVNAFAAQGYNEARAATNDFAATRNAYYGQSLVFSITGHGLGGMHSLIASVDMNQRDIAWYSHNYGTPRTFNAAGAQWYNERFNGEAGERGIYANDTYSERIPAGPNYRHAGTAFYYYGINTTHNGGPNWTICWDDRDGEDPACRPGAQVSNNLSTTSVQDHYFYWCNVGQCGGTIRLNLNTINNFLGSAGSGHTDPETLAALRGNRSSAAISGVAAGVSSIAAASSASVASVASASLASAASVASVMSVSAARASSAAAIAAGAANNAAAAAATATTSPVATPNSAFTTTIAGSGMLAIASAFVGLFVVA